MKKLNLTYWIITGLFGAFMVSTAIPNVTMDPEAVTFITDLGYPEFFIPFIGVAKILGVIAILVPGFPVIKEWAYAGLFFDLSGATYSVIATAGLRIDTMFMLLPLTFLFISHYLYHRRLKASQTAS